MTLTFCILSMFLGAFAGCPATSPAAVPGTADTLKVWPVASGGISVDPLGQNYIISAGSLIKYHPGGDSAYSWSDPQSGGITLIDTGDPMRILVYQKDFNLLRFLNNRLAPLSGPLRLDDLGLTAPLALAVCRRGGFWVLDGSTYRLRMIDPQLNTVVESVPLNLLSGGGSMDYRMIESADQLLLLIPGREILVFDLFANLVKKIPLRVPSFNVYGNRILLVYPDRILLWKDPVTPEEMVHAGTGDPILEACLNHDHLLVRTRDRVLLITR
jgi:hypothetical protein